MILVTAFAARMAIMLVAGVLLAQQSWATPSSPDVNSRLSLPGAYLGNEFAAGIRSRPVSSTDETAKSAAQSSRAGARATTIPPTSARSCQELAERQSAAYLARVNAKEYSAARDIARATADRCLEAGDLKRARDWFLTARAVGPRPSPTTGEEAAQWRRRYAEGLARQRPRQTDLEAAESRMAARRAPERPADLVVRPRSIASKSEVAVARASQVSSNQQVNSVQFSWIAAASGLALFVLGGALLVRRSGAALRGNQRTRNART